ncbi:hypothetical protein AMTRI_Chr05g61160 [Amborella trichopoda]
MVIQIGTTAILLETKIDMTVLIWCGSKTDIYSGPTQGQYCSTTTPLRHYQTEIFRFFTFKLALDTTPQHDSLHVMTDVNTLRSYVLALEGKGMKVIKRYDSFAVVETKGETLSGSTGFNDVADFFEGKNSKIPMTTPVFTQESNAKSTPVRIQIVLPMNKELENLPNPIKETVTLRKVEEIIAAVTKFSGKPTEDLVLEKLKALRSALLRDGLKAQPRCLLARYNCTWSFLMRKEVLIWLDDFELDMWM